MSHVWFNQRFSDGRWLNEGLAEEYASRALEALGAVRPDPWVPDFNDARHVALDLWAPPQQVSREAFAFQQYQYNSAWWVIRQITNDIGLDAFSEILVALNEGEGVYLDDTSRLDMYGTWRLLFDLLDHRTDATGLDELFRAFVTVPEDDSIQRRRPLVEKYNQLFAGDGWNAPVGMRTALSRWRMDEASDYLNMAEAILLVAEELEPRAADLGIDVTHHQETFELAASRGKLGNLHQAMVNDLQALDGLESRRVALDAVASELGLTIDHPFLPLDELDMPAQHLELNQISSARAAVRESAEQANVLVAFEATTPQEAVNEVKTYEWMLAQYQSNLAQIDKRDDAEVAPNDGPAVDLVTAQRELKDRMRLFKDSARAAHQAAIADAHELAAASARAEQDAVTRRGRLVLVALIAVGIALIATVTSFVRRT